MANCDLSRRGLVVVVAVLTVIVIALYFGFFAENRRKPPAPEVSNNTLVTVTHGQLQGEWVDAAQGQGFRYIAFRGIPYAEPPLGDLRFRGPRLPRKWHGILNATKEGSVCTQDGSGSEDCLYLNVYTPRLPSEDVHPKLPVFVFIPGGKFEHGSGGASSTGPDYLLQHDLIVVSFNYRLGVFGFLNLDTEDVPGNAGLKDQVAALRWVKHNIQFFGGDPSKVTVGGNSAGSVSAGLLAVLPATRGLMRAVILESGTGISSWSINPRKSEVGQTVFEELTGKTSYDFEEITTTVKRASAEALLNAGERADSILLERDRKTLGSAIGLFYTGTLEEREQGEEEILITQDPESYIIQSDANDIPMMVGRTAREWGLMFLHDELNKNASLLDITIKKFFSGVVPQNVVPGKDTQKLLGISDKVPGMDVNKYVEELRDYYFSGKDSTCVDDQQCEMSKYLDHAVINADTSHMIRVRARYLTKPTYAYVFRVKSDYNSNTSSGPYYVKDAVVHGDISSYLWHQDRLEQDYYGTGLASMTLRRVVTMHANFIKEGDPTPNQDKLIDVRWKPVLQNDEETYLDIGENLIQLEASLEIDGWKTWVKTFSELRDGKSP